MRNSRYTLCEHRGWFEVHEEYADHDFDPPLWTDSIIIGKFRSREDARTFMIGYTANGQPEGLGNAR